ncbi:putative cyclin-J [Apostichopus japonicus]|uniref:Putative cyclin-J n=2 Tax=Stichopus japonicus TaxID=307972 RepID=A0A2G8KWL2_STIJA|nr:putative cyclin-J [Apostichopus japonicus]
MAETNWWDGDKDLVADIYSSLKKEEGKLVIYKGTSPHLHIRRYLVDWLAVQAECFNMTSHTIHLAVFLLDRIMDRDNSSNEAHLHIVAMACLLIATKFEDKEDMVIKLGRFVRRVINGIISQEEFLMLELEVLEMFQWRVSVPTAVHFIDYFLSIAVPDLEKSKGSVINGKYNAPVYIRKYTKYFLDISLQNHSFSFMKPSLLAASCIASSRVCLNLTPTWTRVLQETTSYSWEDISSYIDVMLKAHEADEMAQLKEAGQAHGMDTLGQREDIKPFVDVRRS